MTLEQPLIDSISKMIVNGNRLDLPQNDVFANYAQVKQCLLKAGGKYKKNGFEFTSNAEDIKTQLTGGTVINDKKKFQFFGTPKVICEQLIELAQIKPSDRCLEPEAGQGAIASLMKEISPTVATVELWKENADILRQNGFTDVIEGCFLTQTPKTLGLFDKIVANPPFTKNQDVDHVLHMYSFLKEGGTLVAITSKSWQTGSIKKQVAFREWLSNIGAEFTELTAGTFKESGTNVATVIIKIVKN